MTFNTEPKWKTYLKASVFATPALLIWAFGIGFRICDQTISVAYVELLIGRVNPVFRMKEGNCPCLLLPIDGVRGPGIAAASDLLSFSTALAQFRRGLSDRSGSDSAGSAVRRVQKPDLPNALSHVSASVTESLLSLDLGRFRGADVRWQRIRNRG